MSERPKYSTRRILLATGVLGLCIFGALVYYDFYAGHPRQPLAYTRGMDIFPLIGWKIRGYWHSPDGALFLTLLALAAGVLVWALFLPPDSDEPGDRE